MRLRGRCSNCVLKRGYGAVVISLGSKTRPCLIEKSLRVNFVWRIQRTVLLGRPSRQRTVCVYPWISVIPGCIRSPQELIMFPRSRQLVREVVCTVVVHGLDAYVNPLVAGTRMLRLNSQGQFLLQLLAIHTWGNMVGTKEPFR